MLRRYVRRFLLVNPPKVFSSLPGRIDSLDYGRGLSAWRECPFYTDRERAALAWTEALTLLTESNVPDNVFALARAQFSEEELVKLTLAVVAINGANRINVAFRTVPGNYQPAIRSVAE